MRADTKTVSIEADAGKVFRFVADPAQLPRWAVGFAKAVRRDGDRWVVVTGNGEAPVRVRADAESGVVDFVMSPVPALRSPPPPAYWRAARAASTSSRRCSRPACRTTPSRGARRRSPMS